MQPLQQTPPETSKKPARMALANATKGRRVLPPRIVIYGTEGIGKSTFAAGADSPIFLGAEDGTSELNVARFPEPQGFSDVLDAIRELSKPGHEYRTLAIDSLDWLEPMVWEKVLTDEGVKSIEKVGGGYGKGYLAALDLWRLLLSQLDRMRHEAGVSVVMIAHAHAKTFQNPEGDDYDRFNLKLNDKASGLIREWSDAVFFANYEVFTTENERTGKSKAHGSGRRLLHTIQKPAFYAKNRYGLESPMALSWSEFSDAMNGRNPTTIRERIEAMLAAIANEELSKKVRGHIATIGDDIQRLSEAENRLKGHVK